MPTLDFKGKQHIYAHHLTVPYRPLVPDPVRSLDPDIRSTPPPHPVHMFAALTTISSSTATTSMR